jgi:hypothetical protein
VSERVALVLGIPGPDAVAGEPDPHALARLDYAPAAADGLARELADHFGYVRDEPTVKNGADLDAAVSAAARRPGIAVVHLLTHGTLDESGELLAIAPDGKEAELPVREWLRRAQRIRATE